MEKGFTILELLVVIFIIVTLSAVLYISTSDYEGKAALARSARQLAQHLREAQEMAMGAQSTDCGGGTETRVFGVYLEDGSAEYLIFANCVGDFTYKKTGASDKLIKKADLEEGVEVEYISGPPPNSRISIAFQPPNPTVYLNDSDTTNQDAEIKVYLADDNSQFKIVKVNTAGRIEIE